MTKTVKPLSSITTYREATPQNPKAAFKGPRMVTDFSQNIALIPDRNPKVLVEATNKHSGSHQRQTMNASGMSACSSHISIGGSPDQPLRVYRSGDVSRPKPGRGVTKPSFQKGK